MAVVRYSEPIETLAAFTYILLFLLFIYLTANGFLPGGSGSTMRHNIQNNPAMFEQSTSQKTT
jgi:hypothetical protein